MGSTASSPKSAYDIKLDSIEQRLNKNIERTNALNSEQANLTHDAERARAVLGTDKIGGRYIVAKNNKRRLKAIKQEIKMLSNEQDCIHREFNVLKKNADKLKEVFEEEPSLPDAQSNRRVDHEFEMASIALVSTQMHNLANHDGEDLVECPEQDGFAHALIKDGDDRYKYVCGKTPYVSRRVSDRVVVFHETIPQIKKGYLRLIHQQLYDWLKLDPWLKKSFFFSGNTLTYHSNEFISFEDVMRIYLKVHT